MRSSDSARSTEPRSDPSGRARTGPARRPFGVGIVDGVSDGLVVALALWTLLYEVVLAAQVSAYRPAAGWLLVAVLVLAGVSSFEARRSAVPVDRGTSPPVVARPLPVWLLPGYAVLVAAAALARGRVGVVPVVVLAVVGLVAVLLRMRGRGSLTVVTDGDHPSGRPDVPALHHAVAGGACAALGVLALFLVRPDADDVFYVNRGTWVAERGVPSLRDTMFGPEVLDSSYGGGLPLTSVETLYGALAHLFGVRNGTFTYLWATPVLAFFVGWALWRLIRAWAPARPLTAFVVAVVFTLLSADSVLGNFWIGRVWQGKVTATCIILPVVLVHLTRLLEERGRWSHVVLLSAGVAFVGLTSAAPLMAVPIAGAALLAALLLRSRRLAAGAGCFLLAPVVAGVVVALGPVAVGGVNPVALPAGQAFEILLGPHPVLVLLGLAALLAVAWIVRGPAAVLGACCVLAAFAVLLPGVFDAVNLLTGAGPVAWRLLLVAPLGALVGLLGATVVAWWAQRRPHPGSPASGWAALAVAAGLVVASGTPPWSGAVGARLTSTPQWKVDSTALDDVEAVSRLDTGPGPWMLPAKQMSVLGIWTTARFAVVPRSFYLAGAKEPDDVTLARERLYRVWEEGAPGSAREVGADLAALDVSLACARAANARLVRRLSRATGDDDLLPVGTMLCHVPSATEAP